jgi:ABC-type polysaccharide/polyol phosphate export permease
VHLWFFASPVLYYYGTMQGKARAVLRLNPMTHLLVSYQQMLFHGEFDHWRGLAATAGVALLAFALGAWLFDRLRDTLAEEV